MNCFEEYANQLNGLRKGEETKIDVHFIVSEPLKSFCFEVNNKIEKQTAGFISMGVESIVVPHISLCMGFVDSYEMLEQVFTAVSLYADNIAPFDFDSIGMYFKGVSPVANQYLFIDPLQNEFLAHQKEELGRRLKNVIHPMHWNVTEEKAHITVGCYKDVAQSARKVVDAYNTIPPCKISQIGVSIAGKYGVCLSLLKVFDLQWR